MAIEIGTPDATVDTFALQLLENIKVSNHPHAIVTKGLKSATQAQTHQLLVFKIT